MYLVKSHRKHKMRISLTTQGENLPKCEHKSELIENTQMTALTETFSQSYVIMISLSPRLHYFNLFFKEEIFRTRYDSGRSLVWYHTYLTVKQSQLLCCFPTQPNFLCHQKRTNYLLVLAPLRNVYDIDSCEFRRDIGSPPA